MNTGSIHPEEINPNHMSFARDPAHKFSQQCAVRSTILFAERASENATQKRRAIRAQRAAAAKEIMLLPDALDPYEVKATAYQ